MQRPHTVTCFALSPKELAQGTSALAVGSLPQPWGDRPGGARFPRPGLTQHRGAQGDNGTAARSRHTGARSLSPKGPLVC